ncbi:DUF423 domain-containing protein [Marinomonas sp. 15G1-11]|uniref:DUF423 domain-containing protein n=1 Tax=Marinomonas phaeophyticola TaxID=3004091 RepID=A0ABT4JZ04_9GAMM|nr:DUF423 domain-containing protein [Marinomonas sp. 15G1-11]MCZ2723559.1 DUF423 domain-containing protein [Marinomonas sp. 15G1-11]
MTSPEKKPISLPAPHSLHISKSQSIWLAVFALMAFLAVAFGAFGAHALQTMVNEKSLSWWHTGCQYMMYHALAGCIASMFLEQFSSVRVALWSFLIGSVFFSGSLFIMALSGMTALGVVTPVGGFLFLLGWGWLIFVFSCFAYRT